ncbi:MAG: biotin/lipoyl-binding protein, partial [Acidobacteria bacterium]
MFEFKLPDLGEGIHEGEILKWHVAEGQTIGEDEPLVDIETDKAAVTIPSPRGGRVVRLGGKEGDTVEVGQVIAVIDDGAAAGAPAGETAPAEAPASAGPAADAARPAPAAGPAAPPAPP